MNKRKALIGWLVYTAAKPIAKRAVTRKAKTAAPTPKSSKSRVVLKSTAIVAATAAAVGSAIFFWRKKSDDGESPATDS